MERAPFWVAPRAICRLAGAWRYLGKDLGKSCVLTRPFCRACGLVGESRSCACFSERRIRLVCVFVRRGAALCMGNLACLAGEGRSLLVGK